jgi:ketosteroid isomerase-like protein
MLKVWSHSAEVTEMGPFGDRSVGWTAVHEEFERDAKLKLGGKIEPRGILVRTDGDLGYVVCFEHGENLSPGGKMVPVDMRATSVFRREAGGWKMVHHHTDQAPNLQAAPSKQ